MDYIQEYIAFITISVILNHVRGNFMLQIRTFRTIVRMQSIEHKNVPALERIFPDLVEVIRLSAKRDIEVMISHKNYQISRQWKDPSNVNRQKGN